MNNDSIRTPGGVQTLRRRAQSVQRALAAIAVSSTIATFAFAGMAGAAQPTIDLGKATIFAVSAGTTVTNTGTTTITGSVGVSPGSSITGFPPAHIVDGELHHADAVAAGAAAAVTAAYLDTAGRTPFTHVPADLGGSLLTPGVYDNATALALTGTLTLNAEGNPDAVFIFQSKSTLITASASRVLLRGGAQPCNVFWQVGSSATLGTGSSFVGTVMALTSISVKTGAHVLGRVLARNGQVSLESNVITRAICASSVGTTTTTSSNSTTSTNSIPRGAPGTGFGGTASSTSGGLILLGVLSVLAAGIVSTSALVRSRTLKRLPASQEIRDRHAK
jgi:hypothetical protein